MLVNGGALDRLAQSCGIQPGYDDIWGKRQPTSDETKRALLAAMGIEAASDEDCERALGERHRMIWLRPLPPVLVARERERIVADLRVPALLAAPLRWSLTQENGETQTGRIAPGELPVLEETEVGGEKYRRRAFALPASPGCGYHWVEVSGAVTGSPISARMLLIVAPHQCYRPEAVARQGRVWGFQLQLYALRSKRNWGIGDFTDLKALVEACERWGAAAIALNPLHALFAHDPARSSPYSPSSRLFGNVIYLDPEAVAEFAECEEARAAVRSPEVQDKLKSLRAAELVNYAEVTALKFSVLEGLYRSFRERHLERGGTRADAFRAFQARGGEALHRHCLFDALQEHFFARDRNVWGWPAWPPEYRDPRSAEVAGFAAANRERIEFFEYLQWQFEEQLGAASGRSLELGLGVGLDLDLAVSVSPGGSESWANQDCYSVRARVGAPPDSFSLNGQNWDLPPFNPEQLREAAYAPFVATLRESMRFAGALRIDHVMGLMRLFWIPAGAAPAQGAYVHYPFEDLLGIVALESVRNRCLVIGEDLGTVPEQVGSAMARVGALSMRPILFERGPDGGFKSPGEYPRVAMVAISTHDLPTLKGYWQGFDLDTRNALGMFPSGEDRDAQVIARAQDRARLLVALEREGLLPEHARVHPVSVPELTAELALQVHKFLARTPSMLMLVQMEDVLGQLQQVNLPGTSTQYPNWCRKLALDLEDWGGDPRVRALVEALRTGRGQAPREAPAPAAPEAPEALPPAPIATYRLQFNKQFGFAQAADLVPYLEELGISHCYASPYLKARPGSMHGYDIIDHNALNPEIGNAADFERFVDALRAHGMGQMLDIVPNHMGVMGADNAWWLDVLENGPASAYAEYFDIDWAPLKHELFGKVLVPVLGGQYGSVLESGELRLAFDAERGEFSLWYHQHRFPIDPGEYPRVLDYRLDQLEAMLGAGNEKLLELQSLSTAFGHLPRRHENSPAKTAERRRDKEVHKQHLSRLCAEVPAIAQFVGENVARFNGGSGPARDWERLHELIAAQAYRLAYWRVASDEINYRRFFDINDLAGLRMEREEVFEATHRLILDLVAQGKVSALRVDHIDGLNDPVQYLRWLQARCTRPGAPRKPRTAPQKSIYLVVEKIIADHERLPEHWPVHGTTGYRFVNLLNGLFVDAAAEAKMDRIYSDFVGERMDFGELAYASRRIILRGALSSELNVLASRLSRIASSDRHTCDFTVSALRDALAETIACFPVYRTYVRPGQVAKEDRRYIEWAVSLARKRSQAADVTIFDFVRDVLLTAVGEVAGPGYRDAVTAFAMKFQQLTGPVMAKGWEDTCLYRYHRLVSLNEVGGDPRQFGMSLAAFHAASQDRLKTWPDTMLATSTHDCKRSEDVRARINALSEMPDRWRASVRRWSRLARSRKRLIEGLPAPSAEDEYLLYQTLVGAWPLGEPDETGMAALRERIGQYMLKAVREAKRHSSWINPNTEYEEAILAFVGGLLEPRSRNAFLADFVPLQHEISRAGMFNSLSQTLIKLASPGVPDIYQGTETWDFSLVDPDNRRPVDYARRRAALEGLGSRPEPDTDLPAADAAALLGSIEDGRIKMFVIREALKLRRLHRTLFQRGDYVPLAPEGARAEHLCAFARRRGQEVALAVAPRLIFTLLAQGAPAPIGEEVWADTRLALPFEGAAGRYRDVFTGKEVRAEARESGTSVAVSGLLSGFPVALALRSGAA